VSLFAEEKENYFLTIGASNLDREKCDQKCIGKVLKFRETFWKEESFRQHINNLITFTNSLETASKRDLRENDWCCLLGNSKLPIYGTSYLWINKK